MDDKQTGLALRFISGKYQGNEFPLKANQEIIVGRGSEFDIVLVEDMVSRKHAKFVTGADYVILQDLGSTNGSFVNGERIKKIRLREGDRVLIGTSIMKLVPYKGEGLEDEMVKTSAPLALPPRQETKQAPAFDPSKALAASNEGPPSLDFIPRSPSSASMPSPNIDENFSSSGSYGVGNFNAPSTDSSSHLPPVHEDEFMSNEPPPEFGQASMTGSLNETPILDLLEIFTAGRKNAILIISNRKDGRLHFRNGRIVYATIGNDPSIPPQKAAYRILTWTSGSYSLYPPKDSEIKHEINEDALELYKRAQKQKEELKRFKQELPPQTHNVTLAMPLRAPLRDLRPDYLETIQIIYNYGILDTILNKSQLSDTETYQHLAYLYKHNYIKAH